MALTKKELREVESLVRAAKKGDAEAFGEIYDKFVVLIYRYIYYRVSKSEAEDLTETVFLRAWEKRKSYRKQKGNSFGSWVFRIAHNAVVDHYRANSKNEIAELTDDIPLEKAEADPVRNLENKFEQAELILALRKLPELQQQVVILKFVNELENEEIAEIIEKSAGAVRVIQFRALNRLKILLNRKEKCPSTSSSLRQGFGGQAGLRNKTRDFSFKTAEDA